jgi:hypothetical protein
VQVGELQKARQVAEEAQRLLAMDGACAKQLLAMELGPPDT